jgi:hypothetical protein
MVYVDSFRRSFLPNLTLRLLPVLNGSDILAPELLVKFMNSFDELRRYLRRGLGMRLGLRRRLHVRLRRGLGLGLRLRWVLDFRFGLGRRRPRRLGSRQILPDLRFRLLPVLNCSTVLAASLLVEFISSLRDARRQINRCLGVGLKLRLGLCPRN